MSSFGLARLKWATVISVSGGECHSEWAAVRFTDGMGDSEAGVMVLQKLDLTGGELNPFFFYVCMFCRVILMRWHVWTDRVDRAPNSHRSASCVCENISPAQRPCNAALETGSLCAVWLG